MSYTVPYTNTDRQISAVQRTMSVTKISGVLSMAFPKMDDFPSCSYQIYYLDIASTLVEAAKDSKLSNVSLHRCNMVLFGSLKHQFFCDNLFWTNETHKHEVTNGKVAKVIKVLVGYTKTTLVLSCFIKFSNPKWTNLWKSVTYHYPCDVMWCHYL